MQKQTKKQTKKYSFCYYMLRKMCPNVTDHSDQLGSTKEAAPGSTGSWAVGGAGGAAGLSARRKTPFLDVVSQDVCGNVHLCLDVSCAIFLLALRCNSEHRRRKAVSRKTALKNVDPGYRGGLRGFGTEERNPELNLSPVLSQAEAVGLSQPPGGLGWAGVS